MVEYGFHLLANHLHYLTMINTTEVAIRQQKEVVVIDVAPKRGHALAPLDGLTVEVPDGTKKAIFRLPDGNESVEAELVGHEDDGCNFAMLPVSRLGSIDWVALAKEVESVQLHKTPQVTLLDGSKPVGLELPSSAATVCLTLDGLVC